MLVLRLVINAAVCLQEKSRISGFGWKALRIFWWSGVWTKKTKFELQLFLVTSHPCSKEIFEFRHAARKKTLGVRELSSPTNNCLYASTTISIIAVQNSDERATASFSLPWLRSCWSYAVHSECLSAFNKDASEIVNWAVSALIRPACLQLYPEKFNSRRKRVSCWAHFFQH